MNYTVIISTFVSSIEKSHILNIKSNQIIETKIFFIDMIMLGFLDNGEWYEFWISHCILFALFCRSVSYTVNGFYKHHVTVVAEVVAVSLELSTEELVLYPSYGMPAEAGENALYIYQYLLNLHKFIKKEPSITANYTSWNFEIFVNWFQ